MESLDKNHVYRIWRYLSKDQTKGSILLAIKLVSKFMSYKSWCERNLESI